MPMSGLGFVRFVVLELRRSLMDVMPSSSTINQERGNRALPAQREPDSQDGLSHQSAWRLT